MSRPICKTCKVKECEISSKKRGVISYREECWKCRAKSNPNYHSHYKRYNDKCRKTVIEHYGGKCECCGETIYQFLTIDHINNNGCKHRKEVGQGRNFMVWLIKHSFPKEFRVLCFNCNCGRSINGGICPHKQNGAFV